MPILTIQNLTNNKIATRGTIGEIGPYVSKEISLTVAQIEQIRPFLIKMRKAGNIAWDVGQYDVTDTDAEFVTANDAGSGSGGGSLEVMDEGSSLGNFTIMNFVGVDVLSAGDANPGQVNVFIPTPAFKSHWDTADGSNGSQAVTESLARLTTRISIPSGGEGTPFSTGGWATQNHDTTLNTNVTFTTPGTTTGWGGDSTMLVEVIDADTVTVLESFTTPALTANATHASGTGNITVTISSFGPDGTKSQATASVTVVFANVLAAAGRSGGRFHIRATHNVDTVTDGSGSYTYVQPEVFLDTNASTPSIAGLVSVAETAASVVTRDISGIHYYNLGSQFTFSANTIDRLNENTQRAVYNLLVSGSAYGLPNVLAAGYPSNAESANFTNWTDLENQDAVDYSKSNWAITSPSYRYAGNGATTSATPRDPWGDGALVASPPDAIMVDTYVDNATALFDDFNGESRREALTFPGVGTWNSSAQLSAGELAVFGGSLMVPSRTFFIPTGVPNANWTGYKPFPGTQPDYSGISAPAEYGRRFTKAAGVSIPSFSMVFSGSFAAGDALADMVAGNLEIDVYRIAIPAAVTAAFGPPPGNTQTLRAHEPFNFALYDDGVTFAGSGIREGSSVGNTINCTFGTGTPADTGMYCVFRILNALTSIDSVTVVFL